MLHTSSDLATPRDPNALQSARRSSIPSLTTTISQQMMKQTALARQSATDIRKKKGTDSCELYDMNWLFLGQDETVKHNVRKRRNKKTSVQASVLSLEQSITLTQEMEKEYTSAGASPHSSARQHLTKQVSEQVDQVIADCEMEADTEIQVGSTNLTARAQVQQAEQKQAAPEPQESAV